MRDSTQVRRKNIFAALDMGLISRDAAERLLLEVQQKQRNEEARAAADGSPEIVVSHLPGRTWNS